MGKKRDLSSQDMRSTVSILMRSSSFFQKCSYRIQDNCVSDENIKIKFLCAVAHHHLNATVPQCHSAQDSAFLMNKSVRGHLLNSLLLYVAQREQAGIETEVIQ